jgi:AcrR family transcriptional regulator
MDMPREVILRHAARLFAEKGFERTSLQDVARSVGLSKAAVYHYFQTKQIIYDAIVENLLDGLFVYAQESVERADTFPEKLRQLMIAHADYFERNHTDFVTLLHAVGGIGTIPGPRQADVRDRYEAYARDLMAAGNAAGDFEIDDVRTATRAVLSMLNWMSRWFDPKGARRASDFAAEYFELFYNGIRPRDR